MRCAESRTLGRIRVNRNCGWNGKGMTSHRIVGYTCDLLLADVPAMVRAYDLNPTIFKAQVSAPKRATKGYKASVVVPPGLARRMALVPGRAGLRSRHV